MASAMGQVDDSTSSRRLNARLNWQFNLELEVQLAGQLTLWQSAGPTFNVFGSGTLVELTPFEQGFSICEQYTYHGGLRYYIDDERFESSVLNGFRGRYFTVQYGLSFDRFVKPKHYEQVSMNERNYVGFLVGYLGNIHQSLYFNVALGAGIDTYPFYGLGPIVNFNIGYDLWKLPKTL